MRRRLAMPALVATTAIGVWLLAAPGVLGLTGGAALGHLLVGPVVASTGVICMSSVVRTFVRVNVVPGAWLLVAPLLVAHDGWWFESMAAGALLIVLALVPEGEPEKYGGGWRTLIGGDLPPDGAGGPPDGAGGHRHGESSPPPAAPGSTSRST